MTALSVTAAEVMSWLVETGAEDVPQDGEGESWDSLASSILHQAVASCRPIMRCVLDVLLQHVPLCVGATVSRAYATAACARQHICQPMR